MPEYDFLIVGAGFAGSVLAERLSNKKKVLVIDERDHIGGNCYDYYNEFGVLVHKYGPHYFRTDNEHVFHYLSKFTKWRPYEYRVRSFVDGTFYPFPINIDTINMFFDLNLKTKAEVKAFLDSKRIAFEDPKNAEEQVLSQLGEELYTKFFKNYTIKQWNTHPKNLSASVTARIPVRYDHDDRYFDAKYQAMPKEGYFNIFVNLLEGSEVLLNTPFSSIKNKISYTYLIYTGAIDRFFSYIYGKLPYRSLKFRHENHHKDFYQNWVQVNYPNQFEYTRIVEIKHATGQNINRTTIVKEYPADSGDPFYPIPNPESSKLHRKYQRDALHLKNTLFIGRLANYQYLNMDQVVEKSLALSEKIKKLE